MNAEPVLMHAIILSDGVIREEGSRKHSFIGSFQVFNAGKFPLQVPGFFVTPFVTNLRPEVKELNVTVRIEEPKSGHVLCSTSLGITFTCTPNQSEVFELPIGMPPVIFAHPGQYKVVVLANNEGLGERFIDVKATSTGGTEDR